MNERENILTFFFFFFFGTVFDLLLFFYFNFLSMDIWKYGCTENKNGKENGNGNK
jgi:hypothetical protein